MSDVTYNKTNWEDSPSKNTPFYAEPLNKMDNGIANCGERVNASIPFDNILDSEDASAVTQRDTYLLDGIDMKDCANRIGTNKINLDYSNYCYTIKNDSISVATPLGAQTMTFIKNITPQVSGRAVVESSIEFDVSNVQGYQNFTNKNFFFLTSSLSVYIDSYDSAYGTNSLYGGSAQYNSATGKGKVTGLVAFSIHSSHQSYIKAIGSLYLIQ